MPTEPLTFDDASWNVPAIQERFRSAIDRFAPDYVIITDSWNSKPILAEALHGYRYFLRLAAQECLCPLNNVRLLMDSSGRATACPRHQLATPDVCRQCVSDLAHFFGSLHQAERNLSGYGTPEYDAKLRRAFAEAEGILAVNPLIAAAVGPYAKAVHVLPSGFDPERFPWPWPTAAGSNGAGHRTKVLFAGLVSEYMKGFHIAHDACSKLWKVRQDFELLATADPPGQVDEFTRYVGWQSQDMLPRQIRQADLLVFPTVAEEAGSVSRVEAMGVGRPVIASRIGGLPYTVSDRTTGLLFEPGNAGDLAAKLAQLLDDPALRERMGQAGRRKFEDEFSWPILIERQYKQILKRREPRSQFGPGFTPSILQPVDRQKLAIELADCFGLSTAEIERMLAVYRTFYETRSYDEKSADDALTFEEAFVLCTMCSLLQPRSIIEIGTSHKSRKILDIVQLLGIGSRIVAYGAKDETEQVLRDGVEHLREILQAGSGMRYSITLVRD